MEEAPKAPRTNKEKVAWLQQKLDVYSTERHQLARRVTVLTHTREELKRELDAAREEISDLRHRLAKTMAWWEMDGEENERVRRELHGIYTTWQLEKLERES
jgi:predicted RNase H-like nuclease (RuvC/YqgF family)